MKKTVLICGIAVIIGILLTLSPIVHATDSDTIFEGDSKSFVDIANSNYLFGDFTNIRAGINFTKTVHVHNPDSRTARIYLYARADQNQYIYLLKQISLSVLDSNGNIMAVSDDLSQKMLVCELSGGESRDIKIRLRTSRKFDPNITSTYQKLHWIFSSDEFASTSDTSSIISPIPDTGSYFHSIIYPLVGTALLSSLIIILSVQKHTDS